MKVLILYATTHGATKVCAEKLAHALSGDAEAFNIRQFSGDISPYSCVVVGTPVYGGSILKEAKEFCRKNRSVLAKKPFAVFFSCFTEDKHTIRGYVSRNFPPELANSAVAVGSFGGAFYFTRLNFMERSIDKYMAKVYAKSAGIAAPDGITDFVTISSEKIISFSKQLKKAVEKTG